MRPLCRILATTMAAAGLCRAAGTLTVTTPGYPADRVANYTTSHVYIDEISGTSAAISFRFVPGVANVTDVELWTNINRRDLAATDKNNDGYPDAVVAIDGTTVTDSAADTDPVTGHYFIPMNMTPADGGAWTITVPVSKTGAYRATARFRTSDAPSAWQWYGLRDHCVVAVPANARDISLYEINVFNIEASGDTFATRSTIEDLHNAPGAAHNANNRWDLSYLKNLGCNWLWFQPIHPNGIDGRENFPNSSTPYDPGSPYAVRNFFEVNPLMSVNYNGSSSETVNRATAMTAWRNFVSAADTEAVGIMLDAPFNHTSFDVELGSKGVQLFQRDGESAWSPADQIRNRDARFFSRNGNYSQRAYDASSIAAGPDRFDFGKWNDVKDVYFGRYDALVEYDAEPERSSYLNEGDWFDASNYEWTNPDFTQGGRQWNITRRVWEYFAHYAVHWLESTRPAGRNRNSATEPGLTEAERRAWDDAGIDGLRCDFGQGLPPQCWEYIINVARSHKWNFVMMAETLDGALGDGRRPVAYRSGRHFDILNESIVFELKAAGDKGAIRNIFETRRQAFGQGLVLTNNTSHDEEVMSDPWQSVVRHLASATVDGVPLVFPGQELGISTTYGYRHYELNFGKQIPHFKRWNSMMPIWNDTDFGNDQLYKVIAAANLARLASPALRSSNRWFLDGNGNNTKINAVAKYQTANASPGTSDVVLAFSNLNRSAQESDTFAIPSSLATLLGIKDGRTYNARNLAAYENPDNGTAGRRAQWLWPAPGLTGAQLKSSGFFVSLPGVPTSVAAWSTNPFEGQFLKVYDVTPPPQLAAPTASTDAYGTVIDNNIAFSWSSAADPDGGVSGYRIKVGTTPGGNNILDDESLTATTRAVTVPPGTTVYASVRQVNNAGVAGSYSDNSVPVIVLDGALDTDKDGQSNGAEQVAGTNPLSPNSVLRVSSLTNSGNDVSVMVASIAGKTYQLETSPSLAPGSWANVGSPVTATGAATLIQHIGGGSSATRFYRVRVVP
jgi:hypothetical protein